MFGSCLPPVVEEGYCLIYVSCVCLYIVISSTYCVVLLSCLSLSCVPIFIEPSVFSNVFFFCIVTGANSTETHYVETIPVTQEQPYDTI